MLEGEETRQSGSKIEKWKEINKQKAKEKNFEVNFEQKKNMSVLKIWILMTAVLFFSWK